MSSISIDNLKFPSGRSVKRLKQDAKAMAHQNRIPLHKALDVIARSNGKQEGWSQGVASLRQNIITSQPQESHTQRTPLAIELGITDFETSLLSWDTATNESSDGLVYNYLLTFHEDSPREILDQIRGLDNNDTVSVSVNAFDDGQEPEPPELMQSLSAINTGMNAYRKLLVLGLNELLSRGLLSLDWVGKSRETTGHIEMDIAGHNSIVIWSDAGFGEVQISVWWKYDHSLHPQANLKGNSKEMFLTPTPLAKKSRYRQFVGIVCAAWLERDKGKYLQGIGNTHITDKYARRSELSIIKNLPNPVPLGYEVEGRFHI